MRPFFLALLENTHTDQVVCVGGAADPIVKPNSSKSNATLNPETINHIYYMAAGQGFPLRKMRLIQVQQRSLCSPACTLQHVFISWCEAVSKTV